MPYDWLTDLLSLFALLLTKLPSDWLIAYPSLTTL